MKYDEQNVEAKFSQSITTHVQDLHRGLRNEAKWKDMT